MGTVWLFMIFIFITKSHSSPIASNDAQRTFKDRLLSRPNLNNNQDEVFEEGMRSESEEGTESKKEKQIHDELSPSILKDIETILTETTNDDMEKYIEEQTHDSPLHIENSIEGLNVENGNSRGIELPNHLRNDVSEPTVRQKLTYILRIFDIIIINPMSSNVSSYDVDIPIHIAENAQENEGILTNENILEDSEFLLNKDRSRSYHQGPVKRSAQFFYPAFVGVPSGVSGYRPPYAGNPCCGHQFYPAPGPGYGPAKPGFGHNYRPMYGQGIGPGYGQGFGVSAAYLGGFGGGGGFFG